MNKLLAVKLLGWYATAAPPVLERYMRGNSCIGATRVTLEFLKRFGVHEAGPLPTKFALTVPSLQVVYASGCSQEEMATARASRHVGEEGGWNGHLVARWGDLLIDSSFDQAGVHLGFGGLDKIVVFPIPGAKRDFRAKYEVSLEDGTKLTVDYITTGDKGYRKTDAWNDENLPAIVQMIYEGVDRDVPRSEARR